MSDQELLELAAKAAGHVFDWNGGRPTIERGTRLDEANYEIVNTVRWNPLRIDGDAFQLALKLRIKIEYVEEMDSVMCSLPGAMSATSVAAIGDVELRYAIVQAAAQKGLTL